MKTHLTKISLALLSTVFLLGCQDLGTGVVESDGLGPAFAPKEGKGKPKPPPGEQVLANLTMTSVIANGQVTLSGTGLIQAEAIQITMAMVGSHGLGFESCIPHSGKKANPDDADLFALFAKINENVSSIKNLWLKTDGNNLGLPSLDNEFEVFWREGPTDTGFRVSLGIGNETTTVTEVSSIPNSFPVPPFKLTFSGGRMRVKHGGKVQEQYSLNCLMDDVITISVTL